MRKIWFLFVLCGCSSVTPRQNFLDHMNLYVGKNINDNQHYHFGSKNDLVDTTVLPNGNNLNTYRYTTYGECVYSFEVDPSGKIISWKILSGEEACKVVP